MEREAARALARVQIAMWVGDDWCRCVICGHVYESTDDFIQRNPVQVGKDHHGAMVIADQACWEAAIDEYREKHPGNPAARSHGSTLDGGNPSSQEPTRSSSSPSPENP